MISLLTVDLRAFRFELPAFRHTTTSLVLLVRLTTYPERVSDREMPPKLLKEEYFGFCRGEGITYITELDISELDGSCGFPANAEPKRKRN